jgi:hypothetical protein
VAPLRRAFPKVELGYEPDRLTGLFSYSGLCLRLEVENPTGGWLPLGNGGFTTGTADLLGNRKERLLSTGFGSELAPKLLVPV